MRARPRDREPTIGDTAGEQPFEVLRALRAQDVARFVERVTPFLCEREAENCLPIGILTGPRVHRGDCYLALIEAGTSVVGAAVMTPPFELVIGAGTSTYGLAPLVEDLATSGFSVTGVTGPVDLVAEFVAAWCQRAGCRARRTNTLRIYRLDRVRPAAGVSGFIRRAEVADRTLLVDWLDAFAVEALGEHDRAAAGELADRYLAGPPTERGLYVWEDVGQPVSMAGISGPTPNGIRVNAVYTPPGLRGRGYASACVATLSQAQLDGGRRYCFLFTDLANPTSNHIYQAIGYEPVSDTERFEFLV